jgi:hypothetical protein
MEIVMIFVFAFAAIVLGVLGALAIAIYSLALAHQRKAREEAMLLRLLEKRATSERRREDKREQKRRERRAAREHLAVHRRPAINQMRSDCARA